MGKAHRVHLQGTGQVGQGPVGRGAALSFIASRPGKPPLRGVGGTRSPHRSRAGRAPAGALHTPAVGRSGCSQGQSGARDPQGLQSPLSSVHTAPLHAPQSAGPSGPKVSQTPSVCWIRSQGKLLGSSGTEGTCGPTHPGSGVQPPSQD